MIEHPQSLVPRLAEPFGPFDSMLDVGSGGGIVGLEFWKIPHNKIFTIDIWIPATPWQNFTRGHALDSHLIFGAKSFDIVMAAELIEHLPKDDGPRLLKVLDLVARKLVILTTPNGFLEQDPEKNPHEEWSKNPYQKHLSGWTEDEFKLLGYWTHINNDKGYGEGGQVIAWKVPE